MKQAMRNTERTFGVEIECFVPHEFSNADIAAKGAELGLDIRTQGWEQGVVRPFWKLTTDASLRYDAPYGTRGIEVVSPILKGTEGLELIEKICKVLKDVRAIINKKAGLHVHHDAGDFRSKDFDNLKGIYSRCEVELDKMMPRSRRENNNSMCRSVRDDLNSWGINWNDRYHKLNLAAYSRFGTVEFRHHAGTVDAEKIIAWVHITQAMMERAKRNKVRAAVPNKSKLFIALCLWDCNFEGNLPMQEVVSDLRKYITRRQKTLAA